MSFSTQGTVTINLSEHERLVKVYDAVKENKSFICYGYGDLSTCFIYVGDEANKILAKEVENLKTALEMRVVYHDVPSKPWYKFW